MSELISIKRITFKNMPDLIITKSEYNRFGNLLKLCSEYSIDIKDIKNCKNELIAPSEFPTNAWEG